MSDNPIVPNPDDWVMTSSEPWKDLYLASGADLKFPTPAAITFCARHKPILVIHEDGRVTIGEGFTPDEAGKAALDAFAEAWPALLQPYKDRIAGLEALLRDLMSEVNEYEADRILKLLEGKQ